VKATSGSLTLAVPWGCRESPRLPAVKSEFLTRSLHDSSGKNASAFSRSVPEVYSLIAREIEQQHLQLELIASGNFASADVLEATASVFTNKYAEGYPGKRYYGGCEITGQAENLARDRAKQLFGLLWSWRHDLNRVLPFQVCRRLT
jgi:hypothetical protein